jgi:hypothetical protein
VQIRDNEEMVDQLYQDIIMRVRELSGIRSAGIHVTELIYCLTKSYYERTSPLPITRQSALTMAMGIGLERTIIPIEKRVGSAEKDGIDYSPDFWYHGTEPAELKTTRMSTKKTIERTFPETWVQQIKCYCYAMGKNKYHLGVVHLLGNYHPPFPSLLAVTFEFTDQELQEQWDYILFRKKAFLDAAAQFKPPDAKRWSQDWECEYCQYKERCGL